MQLYEYYSEVVQVIKPGIKPKGDTEDMNAIVNKLAAAGWEIDSIAPLGYGYGHFVLVTFRRRV